MDHEHRKHPFRMFARLAHLLIQPNPASQFVEKSYDRISYGYDETWTNHMRDLTGQLIDQSAIQKSSTAVDLTCGTGYATNLLAQSAGTNVIGVDRSQGMLDQAEANYGQSCEFIKADILEYLNSLPSNSLDVVTCCWGLGYSKPFAVLRQIRRVLKPTGKVAIIDNSLFSLQEIMYCSFLTFMECPIKLENLMRFRFLTGSWQLGLWLRLAGMEPQYLANGKRIYHVDSGSQAIERLRATGAAAGFEYASNDEDSEDIFKRFAEIIEEKHMTDGQIPIIHRYLSGIATK